MGWQRTVTESARHNIAVSRRRKKMGHGEVHSGVRDVSRCGACVCVPRCGGVDKCVCVSLSAAVDGREWDSRWQRRRATNWSRTECRPCSPTPGLGNVSGCGNTAADNNRKNQAAPYSHSQIKRTRNKYRHRRRSANARNVDEVAAAHISSACRCCLRRVRLRHDCP